MAARTVIVRLSNAKDATQKAWMAMRVTPLDENQVQFDADPMAAVKRDTVSFLHPPTENEAKVLKSEIVGGILMARKQAGRIGFRAELLYLGGIVGDLGRVAEVPSVAYAVGATMAVLHGLGVADRPGIPRGGFGWSLDAVELE
jgi:hypothetical protein